MGVIYCILLDFYDNLDYVILFQVYSSKIIHDWSSPCWLSVWLNNFLVWLTYISACAHDIFILAEISVRSRTITHVSNILIHRKVRKGGQKSILITKNQGNFQRPPQ